MDWKEWYVWRPVRAQWATLKEIETHWSLADLAKAHLLLDIEDEAAEHENKQLKSEMDRAKQGKR